MICVSLANMEFDDCLKRTVMEPFVEFRFDLLDVGPAKVISLVSKAKKCISTCRQGKMSEQNRFLLLQTALEAGTDFIDFDIESDIDFMQDLLPTARSKGCDVIISYHDFQKTPQPEELEQIVQSCISAGADIVKVACQVNKTDDLVHLLHLCGHKFRKVVIGMGDKGIISRVAAPLMGAEFTFASAGEGLETAPGQISKERIQSILEQIQAK